MFNVFELWILATFFSLASSEVCFKQGTCVFSPYVDISRPDDRMQCYEVSYTVHILKRINNYIAFNFKNCVSNPSCSDFTFIEENEPHVDNQCFLFSECVDFDIACRNCYSGSRNCTLPQCSVAGKRLNDETQTNLIC